MCAELNMISDGGAVLNFYNIVILQAISCICDQLRFQRLRSFYKALQRYRSIQLYLCAIALVKLALLTMVWICLWRSGWCLWRIVESRIVEQLCYEWRMLWPGISIWACEFICNICIPVNSLICNICISKYIYRYTPSSKSIYIWR